jgi:glutamine synthetase
MGQRHRGARGERVSASELVALVCCDLGAIVRGRSLPSSELAATLDSGVSWVPANHALTPLGTLAEPNPFGSTGDLRLLPDPDTHVRVEATTREGPLELLLCDIVETDGAPWQCCSRSFLRRALGQLESDFALRLSASFEHEFQLLADAPAALPFSLDATRRAGAFAGAAIGALLEAGAGPERFIAEFGPHQFEIPVEPAEGLAAADRAIVLKETVREVARREGIRASFAPLLDPAWPGNGVHIHLSLLDSAGIPVLYDASRPACLSQLGARFAAGILLHAEALSALSAPSPVSAARLAPHRWSAGAVCVGPQNREALLRIPPLVPLARTELAGQLRLEYRGADATANPYLALGAIVYAGLDGLRRELPTPALLDRDPTLLDVAQQAEFRVGGLPRSLEESLRALELDRDAREWLSPLMYEAFVSVKRAEIEATAELDPGEICRRYADIY